jgi:hypothetical protein
MGAMRSLKALVTRVNSLQSRSITEKVRFGAGVGAGWEDEVIEAICNILFLFKDIYTVSLKNFCQILIILVDTV